ncbi:Monooxygenase aurF [Acrodontium crateriforme]|uniref:dihydrofolate reductase n=1 Tax=Acrodontium crateriforme TaxID=150365 RepID=A0AAQ3M833_9PEZI|nr:Monooxygenase aurF [Acrodontium crateriforme]
MAEKIKVAVIGLGSCGLATLKNLREAGFNVVGFESNSYVGGLWQYDEDPQKTTVLKSTIANLSKQAGGFTDYPFSNDVPDFPTAAQTAEYLRSYATHFNLMPYTRLSTKINRISRADDGWKLEIQTVGEKTIQSEVFDKIAVCVGLQVQKPKIPAIKGAESFTGRAIHSNAYKRPEDWKDKRVVVVGLGNTGPDTAVDLIGHASDIWLSHRKGNAVFSRRNPKGKPGDHVLSLRLLKLGGLLNKTFPNFSQKASLIGMKKMQSRSWNVPDEWNLGPFELPTRKTPTMNEDLVPALHAGKMQLKSGLFGIDGSTLFFTDGSSLDNIDGIIFCTGFRSDYSVFDPEVDPTKDTRKDWDSLTGANGRPLPRLYQGIFSVDFPESLAFLGTSPFTPQACLNYDISSAAVAQVWLGNSTLPSEQEMNKHIDTQHEVVCNIARTGDLANTNLRNNWDWLKWCDDAAGLVAATTKNGIGKNNALPWPMLKKEMAYFARVTKRVPAPTDTGSVQSDSFKQSVPEGTRRNVVIMGRKTWESIPPKFRPLKDRTNIVISTQQRSQLGPMPDDVIVASDIISGLKTLESLARDGQALPVGRAFVIGGSSIYKTALELPQTRSILLTRIQKDFDCDSFFPTLEGAGSAWHRRSQKELRDFVQEDVAEGPISEGEGTEATSFEFQLYQRD